MCIITYTLDLCPRPIIVWVLGTFYFRIDIFGYCPFFIRPPIAPSKPTNLRFTITEPSKNTRPRMKVTWGPPSEENGIITKYTLTYSYNYYFNGVTNSTKVSTNSQTFEYTFDVLGGIEYNVSIYAKTIKPGPKEEQVESVPVYRK
mgnify:CR=1 FL=1